MTWPARRRAYLLGEVVGVLPLIAVTATLLTAGVLALLRTQHTSAEMISDCDTFDTLLESLRQDTRAATAAYATSPDTDVVVLELANASGLVRYLCSERSVTREAETKFPAENRPRQWGFNRAQVDLEFEGMLSPKGEPDEESPGGTPNSLVRLEFVWLGEAKRQVEPARRFDAAFFVGRGYGK